MKKIIPSLALLLIAAGIADACPIVRGRVVRKRAVIVQEVLAVQNVLTPLVLSPSYVGYYSPQGDSNAAVVAAIDKLDKLGKKLDALSAPPPLPGAAPPPAQSAVRGAFSLEGVIVTACARCHAEKVAADSGEGQVLVEADGKASVLSPAERKACLQDIVDGTMPKGKPLPDDVRAAAKALLPAKKK